LIDHNRRSKAGGWTVFEVNVGTAAPRHQNLLEEHGQISRTNQGPGYDLHRSGEPAHSSSSRRRTTFPVPHGINKDAKEVVALRVQSTVNGEYSGILLFKIIITEAQVDTKSTTTLMCDSRLVFQT
jgi:hypothetical protein